MKVYWGMEVYLHAFLTLALDGGEWSASCSSFYTPILRVPSTHWIWGWVGPRVSLLWWWEKILSLPLLPQLCSL